MKPNLVCRQRDFADRLPCALLLMICTVSKRVSNKTMLWLRLMVPLVAVAIWIDPVGLTSLVVVLLCLARLIDLAEWIDLGLVSLAVAALLLLATRIDLTGWIDLGLALPEPSVTTRLLLVDVAAPCERPVVPLVLCLLLLVTAMRLPATEALPRRPMEGSCLVDTHLLLAE